MAADLTDLSSQVQQLLGAAQADQLALAADRAADFTGIRAARQKLVSDLRAVRAARRGGK